MDVDLNALVEEATVDCYDDDEQRSGFCTMIVDHLALPFETVVLGVPVTVTDVDLDAGGRTVARCIRGSESHWMSILDLPLPAPPPAGAEWVEAYRYWWTGAGGE